MKILSLDLGKFKSVACFHETDFQAEARTEFRAVVTDREVFREVIADAAADVVVFETCPVEWWFTYPLDS